MKLNLILIYLLKLTEQTGDLALKQKLLDEWDIRDNFHDARGDIVIDVFDDKIKENSNENRSDEVIILPFFSDEVLSLDDIPEDTNWNFVEINSATDLLAMENPHQKKYKTQSAKRKTKAQKKTPRARKVHNNWEKFKSRFPVYVERGFAPVSRALPDTGIPVILEPRIAKRQAHYYPIPKFEEEKALIPKVDPWQNVKIIEDKNPHLAFGAYDELGNKIQKNIKEKSPKVNGPSMRNKKEIGKHEQIINISIDFDDLDPAPKKIPKRNIQPGQVVGFKQFQAIKNEVQQNTAHDSTKSSGGNSNDEIPLKSSAPKFQVFEAIEPHNQKMHNAQQKTSKIPITVQQDTAHDSTKSSGGNSNDEVPLKSSAPKFQVFKAIEPHNQKVHNTQQKTSKTPFTVFASNAIKKFKKQNIHVTTRPPTFKVFEAVRKKKFANPVSNPLKTPATPPRRLEKIEENMNTSLPVFEVFEANTEHKDESGRLVFTVFNPIPEEDTVDQIKETDKLIDQQQETLTGLTEKFSENQLGKRIDNLYNKIATLANFEAFKGSPSVEISRKDDEPPSGVTKLVKPVKVLMKNEKLKLTKPVILNLQNNKAEKEIQIELLARLKKQVQGLKLKEETNSESSMRPDPQQARPKRARPPKPEGSPRNKNPGKSSSVKKDLKMKYKRQTSNANVHKSTNQNTESHRQVKPPSVSQSQFSSVPKRKQSKTTEQSSTTLTAESNFPSLTQ